MPSDLKRFMAAIRSVESNNNYDAIGPATRYGRATGAYQFLDSTWAGYRGYRRAVDAPEAVQDARAAELMTRYHRQFGRWGLVAVAWHAGPGTAARVKNNPAGLNGIGDGYTSTKDYVRKVMARADLGRTRRGHDHVELRPWQVPRNVVGRAGRIVVDPDLLLWVSRRLADHLATVESGYHRCRGVAADVGRIRVADPRLDRRLEAALDAALDDWHGLRRLGHLISRDIGYVVEARHRALGADSGDLRRRERATVERLVGSLSTEHSRSTRRHTGELMRALFRPDRHTGHLHQHLPTTPRRNEPGHRGLDDVRLGRAWGGTKSIFDQFVTPFLRREGLSPGSEKRGYDTVPGPPMSDHYDRNANAYAVDYPTASGADEARALARAMGFPGWRPNGTDRFLITVDGQRFSVQILWGSGIQHGDHVHVGIRRA